MATIAGVECRDGALLVADRVRTREGRIVTRDADHLVDLGAVGAASVGGHPGRFADELAASVRSYRLERDELCVDAFVRLVDEARDRDAAAVVAAHDDAGRPRVRAVDDDGEIPADPVAVRGSGASVVLGGLDVAEPPTLDRAADALASAFAAAAERDPGTGADLDRYRLTADGD